MLRTLLAGSAAAACTLAILTAAPALGAPSDLTPAEQTARSGVGACRLPNGPGIQSNYVAVGFPVPKVRMASRGKVRIAILFVEFPGARGSERTPASLWEQLKPAQDFFRTVSYGQMEATLVPHLSWIRMSKRAGAYGIRGDGSLTSTRMRAYMQEAVSKADPKVDFSGVDGVVIASTPTAGDIEYSPAFVAATPSGGLSTREGMIANGSLAAADVWGPAGYGWRILPHELGHAMGLADLYDGPGTSKYGLHGYVGMWDLMGNPASPTPEYNAWNRWLLGWITDRQIVCTTAKKPVTAKLTAVGIRGGTKAIVIPVSSRRAVVVESRRPTAYDASSYFGSPIDSGALVYVVDSSVRTLEGPIRVVPDDRGDPIFDLASAPLGPGDRVTAEGLRISVVSSDGQTDTVRIERAR